MQEEQWAYTRLGGGVCADGGWEVALGSMELSEEPFPSSPQRSDCSTFL